MEHAPSSKAPLISKLPQPQVKVSRDKDTKRRMPARADPDQGIIPVINHNHGIPVISKSVAQEGPSSAVNVVTGGEYTVKFHIFNDAIAAKPRHGEEPGGNETSVMTECVERIRFNEDRGKSFCPLFCF